MCIPLYGGSESSTQWHVKWPCSHWAKHLIFGSTVQALEVAWLHWPPFLESEWTVSPYLRAVTHFQRFPHVISVPAPCLLLWQNSVMPLPFRSYVLQLSALTLHPHAINHITIWSWYNVVWCQLGPECGKWSQVPWQDVDVKEDSRVHDCMIASLSPSPWGKTNFDLGWWFAKCDIGLCSPAVVYGITTGFGKFAHVVIPSEKLV